MPRKHPITLEPFEIEALLGAPNVRCRSGKRNRAILEIMLRCGLRVAEVVKLRPCDILWQSGFVQVVQGKGGKDRKVPLRDMSKPVLEAWDQARPKGSRTLFCRLNGRALSTRHVQRMVKSVARRADLERRDLITPHVFRHTFATSLLSSGVDVRFVQEALGHARLTSTQIYTHVAPSALQDAIRRADRQDGTQTEAERLANRIMALPTEARAVLRDLLEGVPHG